MEEVALQPCLRERTEIRKPKMISAFEVSTNGGGSSILAYSRPKGFARLQAHARTGLAIDKTDRRSAFCSVVLMIDKYFLTVYSAD